MRLLYIMFCVFWKGCQTQENSIRIIFNKGFGVLKHIKHVAARSFINSYKLCEKRHEYSCSYEIFYRVTLTSDLPHNSRLNPEKRLTYSAIYPWKSLV